MTRDRTDLIRRYPRRAKAILLAILAVMVSTAATHGDQQPSRTLYCWNQDGQRVCSDTLPMDALDRARIEIDPRSGLHRVAIEPASSAEERAAMAASATQRQLDQIAEQTRTRTDQAMLLSYPSEQELRRVFNERAATLDSHIRTARYNVASLREGLIAQLRNAGERDLNGRRAPGQLADDIRQRHAQLLAQQQRQASFEQQRQQLHSEIALAVQRYRALRAQPLASALSPERG